jgi:hypothetical protein
LKLEVATKNKHLKWEGRSRSQKRELETKGHKQELKTRGQKWELEGELLPFSSFFFVVLLDVLL